MLNKQKLNLNNVLHESGHYIFGLKFIGKISDCSFSDNNKYNTPFVQNDFSLFKKNYGNDLEIEILIGLADSEKKEIENKKYEMKNIEGNNRKAALELCSYLQSGDAIFDAYDIKCKREDVNIDSSDSGKSRIIATKYNLSDAIIKKNKLKFIECIKEKRLDIIAKKNVDCEIDMSQYIELLKKSLF